MSYTVTVLKLVADVIVRVDFEGGEYRFKTLFESAFSIASGLILLCTQSFSTIILVL